MPVLYHFTMGISTLLFILTISCVRCISYPNGFIQTAHPVIFMTNPGLYSCFPGSAMVYWMKNHTKETGMTQDEFYQHLDTLYEAGDPKEVERFLTFHVDFYKDGETLNPPLLIAALSELGGFYRGVSRYEESADCFQQTLDLVGTYKGIDSMAYATTLNNLAGTYRLMQEPEKAEKCFLEARRLFEDHGTTSHYLYASVLNNLALLYLGEGRKDEGIDLLCQSTDLMKQQPGHEEEVCTGILNQAYYYLETEDIDQALSLVKEAINGFTALPYKSTHLASARALLAQLLFRLDQAEDAEMLYRAVRTDIVSVFGKNADYYFATKSLAVVCEALEKTEEALQLSEEAVDILSALYGENSPQVQQEKEALALTRQRLTLA